MKIPIYIDSNVFVFYALETESLKNNELSMDYLNRVHDKSLLGFTGVITWDEVVFNIKRFTTRGESIKFGEKLLGFPNLLFLGINKGVIEQAQQIYKKFSLKHTMDAIHASLALKYCNGNIISDDGDFDEITGINRFWD